MSTFIASLLHVYVRLSFINDREQNPAVPVHVFTDADISERPDDVAKALAEAKVLFCSLVVDFVQVQWIKER